MTRFLTFLCVALLGTTALADEPEVLGVKVQQVGMVWNISVTLKHPDTGWDHYADGWEVLDGNKNRLAFRELAHPHVEEQPFTRSITGVVIPDGTREIYIKPRCSVDGWSDTLTRVELSP